jgi:phosphatidylglycerophosphate synthase
MSRALVFVNAPVSFTVNGVATLDRLVHQLRVLGGAAVTVVARPGTHLSGRYAGAEVVASPDLAGDLALIRAAAPDSGQLVLVDGDLVAHDSAVNAVISPDARATCVLTGDRHDPDRYPALLRQRGRVISLATSYHRVSAPNGSLRGLLKVAEGDGPALLVVLDQLDDFVATNHFDASPVTAVTLALTRAGVTVGTRPARMLLAERVTDAQSQAVAAHALDTLDEPKTKLRLAVKEQDDLFTTYCVSPISPYVVKLAARLGFTPTGVTWISILFVGLAATLFAVGSPAALIGGAALLYVGFLFDCVDGQLARFRQRYSRFGGWLDVIADRGKEYLAYAGLAAGAARHGNHVVWVLALAAMVLQTTRHMVDAWYSALQDEVVAALPRAPLTQASDNLGAAGPAAGRVTDLGAKLGRLSASMEAERRSPAYWFKRTIVFPIGERWLALGLVAAVFGAQWSLTAMLIWGGLAFGYVVAGRSLRAHAMRVAAMAHHDRRLHRDDGPLAMALSMRGPRPLATAVTATLVSAGLLALAGMDVISLRDDWWLALAGVFALLPATAAGHPHTGALDWLTSAGLRANEALFIVLVGANSGLPIALTFALIALIALFHYDLVGLLDKGASPLRWRRWGLGWDGRIAVLGAAALLGIGQYAAWALLAYLAVVFVGGALAGLLSRPPAATPAAMPPRDAAATDELIARP